jgi:molybdopterin-guanine dinucleotide biosynthesis protein A
LYFKGFERHSAFAKWQGARYILTMIPKVVILAGGEGKRMGGYKPFAPYGHSTLIEATMARLKPQTREIVINAGAPGTPLALPLSCLDARLIFDELPGLGPLSGVLSALDVAKTDGDTSVITAPCDMPHLPVDMVAQLLTAPPADVVYFRGARDYPLCALWQVSFAAVLRDALQQAAGGLAVMRFLATLKTGCIAVSDEAAFTNINHPPLAPG